MPIRKRDTAMKMNGNEFIPTAHKTSDDKARFANQFIRFLELDFPESAFNQKFYQQLSMCFGHIAHYDKNGFYGTWFGDTRSRLQFIEHTLRYLPVGYPEYTFSDVEKALQQRVVRLGILTKYRDKLAAET